jgi:hypothetical protein
MTTRLSSFLAVVAAALLALAAGGNIGYGP